MRVNLEKGFYSTPLSHNGNKSNKFKVTHRFGLGIPNFGWDTFVGTQLADADFGAGRGFPWFCGIAPQNRWLVVSRHYQGWAGDWGLEGLPEGFPLVRCPKWAFTDGLPFRPLIVRFPSPSAKVGL